MVTLEINQIFNLLIDSVLNKSPMEFKNHCESIEMTYKEPIPDVGQYSQLPPFDDRVCYEFNSPKANSVIFELLIYSDKILQAGVNLYYDNTGLFSNYCNRAFELIKGLLDDYFGGGDEIKIQNTIIYNYGDHNLLGYVSLINKLKQENSKARSRKLNLQTRLKLAKLPKQERERLEKERNQLYTDQSALNFKIGNAKIINEYFQIS